MSDPFNCYLMGVEPLLIRCAEILLERGHRIEGVISDAAEIVAWAASRELPLLPPGPDLAERLPSAAFDYFFSITNFSVAPDAVLDLPRRGAINFHDGPLPAYAGFHVPAWAILNREDAHGVTWHEMETAVTGGDILKQQAIPIAPDETAFSLRRKCREAGAASFPELVDELAAGTGRRIPQDPEAGAYFGRYRRPAAAATIDFARPAAESEALIRGLDFGPDANPLALPKLRLGEAVYAAPGATIGAAGEALPGAITAVSPDQIEVAAADRSLVFTELRRLRGTAVSLADVIARHELAPGARLPLLAPEARQRLSALNEAIARHEPFWVERLGEVTAVAVPYAASEAEPGGEYRLAAGPLPDDMAGDAAYLIAAFAAYLARLGDAARFDLGFTHDLMRAELAEFAAYFAGCVPLRVVIDFAAPVAETMAALQEAVTTTQRRRTYARDVIARYPHLSPPRYPILAAQVADFAAYTAVSGSELAFLVDPAGRRCGWVYDTAVYGGDAIETMRQQFVTFLGKLAAAGDAALAASHLRPRAED